MAASYIPSGYRLATIEDAGKVFGTDLEPNFYIDNTVIPSVSLLAGFSPSYGYINHPSYAYNDLEVMNISNSSISLDDIHLDNHVILYSSSSWNSSIDFTKPFTITSRGDTYSNTLGISYLSNNFIYVKDIDPYNIILTKPKLTVKCADMTMEEDLVVQLDDSFVVPTGTLEITENGTHDVSAYASANVNVAGSGAGVNFTLSTLSYVSGGTYQYTLDGTNWVDAPPTGSRVNLYGQAIFIKMYSSSSYSCRVYGNKMYRLWKNDYDYFFCIPEENETISADQRYD